MRFLRTASTGRLLAVIATVIVVIAAGAAIAVAATGNGPVPARKSLAQAVHQALSAPKVQGISADITFTNNLIDSSDFTGQGSDPVLQGASGRMWLSNDGRLRIELQSTNGDAQIVVDHRSFSISDPAQNTVYEGTLPAEKTGSSTNANAHHAIPTITQIESEITRLMGHVNLSGARPTDVAGQAAYSVSISPRHDGGLLGSAQIAWDAVRGVPLSIGIYARGNSTPVLAITATHISYGAVPASDFAVSPPAGSKVVTLSGAGHPTGSGDHALRRAVSGVHAVAAQLPFGLVAPKSLVGLPRHTVSLIGMGGAKAALVAYGENLGGMVVIESRASAKGTATSSAGGGSLGAMRLPTVSIDGVTGTELSTALGTVVHFTRDGVSYTVIGSVPATAAELAARAL